MELLASLANVTVPQLPPTAPVRHPLRLGLQGGIRDGSNLVRAVERLASPTGRYLPQTLRALQGEALTPARLRAHLVGEVKVLSKST